MSQAVPAQLQGQPVYILKENVARTTGEDVVSNMLSVSAVVGELVRGSLGPAGMNKMLVGTFGDITYSKSGATILSEANVEHPVGKLYVEVAKTINKNEGDGASRAIYLASKLVERGAELTRKGIHPAVIAEGYAKSTEYAMQTLEKLAIKVKPDDRSMLRDVVKTLIVATMGKTETETVEKCTDIALEAALRVTQKGKDGYELDQDDVSVVSKVGGQLLDSELVNGLIIEKEVAAPGMPRRVEGARIALIDFALEVKKTEISTELEFNDPRTMMKMKEEERSTVEEKVAKIAGSGANVVFSQKGIDDRASSALSKANIMAVKNVKRSDMERLVKATGAKMTNYHGDLSKDLLGRADLVEERKYEDEKLVVVEEDSKSKAVAILLRGVGKETVKDSERAINKGLSAVKMIYEEPLVVPTAGSELLEMALRLKKYSTRTKGEINLAIDAYSEALIDVVQAMAANSGMTITKTLAELRASHTKTSGRNIGIDAIEGKVVDSKKKRIIEPVKSVRVILRSATELASILLRVDDMLLSVKMPERKEPRT